MADKSYNILLADDDPEDLELIEDAILRHEPGALMQKVVNGKAVLDFLDNKKSDDLPCLIIMDYNMPEMNGIEVLEEMHRKQKYQEIPKIILSTSNARTHIDESLKNGALEYFIKPNNMTELNQLAGKLLEFCEHH